MPCAAADVEWQLRAPTSRPSDDVTNGRVARDLPVTSALLIRRDLAQEQSLTCCAWSEDRVAGHSPKNPPHPCCYRVVIDASTREHRDDACCLFNAPEASAVLCYRNPCLLYLPRAAFSSQLTYELEYLSETGGSDGVTFRDQST